MAMFPILVTLSLLCFGSAQYEYPAVPLGSSDECPLGEEINPVLNEVDSNATSLLQDWIRTHCGQPGTGWTQVGHIDMRDPEQQCPSGWREYSVSGERLCGRLAQYHDWVCNPVFFGTNGQAYTQVCGRIISYLYGSPDGYRSSRHEQPITTAYVDGISLTYGSPRNHIWSFYGATTAAACNPPSNPASFVGGHYFCEYDERLWDGDGCSSDGCAANDPPWFLVNLQEATTENLEVRICADNGPHDEDTPIQVLELYVK